MASLNALIARIERLATAELKSRVAKKAQAAIHGALIAEFVGERDPYGERWAPRKKATGWAVRAFGLIDDGHKLLDKSGKMIDSITSRASNDGAIIKLRGYAKFHQTGTRNMVARKLFPENSRGLGLWSAPVNEAATAAVRELAR